MYFTDFAVLWQPHKKRFVFSEFSGVYLGRATGLSVTEGIHVMWESSGDYEMFPK